MCVLEKKLEREKQLFDMQCLKCERDMFKNQRKCNTSKQNFNVFDIQSVNCFDREIESLISSLLLRTRENIENPILLVK